MVNPQNVASNVSLIDYDIEMFGSKHPDFIGAILVRDPKTDVVHVADQA